MPEANRLFKDVDLSPTEVYELKFLEGTMAAREILNFLEETRGDIFEARTKGHVVAITESSNTQLWGVIDLIATRNPDVGDATITKIRNITYGLITAFCKAKLKLMDNGKTPNASSTSSDT